MVRSTQTVEQNAATSANAPMPFPWPTRAPGGALPPAAAIRATGTSGRTEETTNYEISKKVTTSTVDGGDVKKVSVAVVVDGSGDTAASYKPRTPEEMSKITALVEVYRGRRFDAGARRPGAGHQHAVRAAGG